MALPEWADVVAIAPELGALKVDGTPVIGPPSQDALLAIAIAQCNAASWATLLNAGIIYLAAHLGTLARTRGGGMVTQESVGQLQRAYATPQGIKGSLGLTSYGAEYKRLLKLLPGAIGAVY